VRWHRYQPIIVIGMYFDGGKKEWMRSEHIGGDIHSVLGLFSTIAI